MPELLADRVITARAAAGDICGVERLLRTMANAGDRRRREAPERATEALFLGIAG